VILASGERLKRQLTTLIGDCRESQGQRASEARTLRQWKFTGSDGTENAIYNRLGVHIDRLAAYLYSPVDLRFDIEFENNYPKDMLDKADAAAKYFTRQFEKQDLDVKFGLGVEQALDYGSSIFKVMYGHNGLTGRLVNPWNFAVYREDLNSLDEQEVLIETMFITKQDLWRRISHLPDAADMVKRATANAKKGGNDIDDNSYFKQVILSGSGTPVDLTGTGGIGGTVNIGASQSYATLAPAIAQSLITLHELTILDDETEDYTTVQFCEPDIIITPRGKKHNLFCQGEHPYTLIQANMVRGYLWGRSEMSDLFKMQNLLRERMEDVRKVMNLQYDKLLAFMGFSGMNDEMYDNFRNSGWIAQQEPGGKVEDLTPKLPAEAFQDIETIIRFMDDVGGFQNILSGQGENGVRAASHAQTLMRTASPRLRDRAILIERQCSEIGNKAFELLRNKEAKAHWSNTLNDTFLLSDLPDDYRVVVDSHSSSPIYQEDHVQMAFSLAKLGIIDGESVIDMVQVPGKEKLKAKLKEKQAREAQLVKEHPELLTKGKGKR
jgi:hypothetical protein